MTVMESVTESSQTLRQKAEVMQTDLKRIEKQIQIQTIYQPARVENDVIKMLKKKTLIDFVIENCEDEAVWRWLKRTSETDAFSQLVDMFYFLKKHIEEEEKKNHSNNIHITFIAHGCIEDPMIPASCLLPLSSIRDVTLYSPWNCAITPDVAYGVATGRMKPQHREFFCANEYYHVPHEGHQPTYLPDGWNSMKKAGNQKIPNIMLSPLNPPEDRAWKRFESLKKQHGPPGRNRIFIPFILPGKSSSLESVPFFIVTLALSLVLLSSRFKATVHLTACLGARSARNKFDQEYLKHQYACTINHTGMTCSPDMFKKS